MFILLPIRLLIQWIVALTLWGNIETYNFVLEFEIRKSQSKNSGGKGVEEVMVQKNFIGITNHKTIVKCKSNINVMLLSRKQQNVLHYLQRNEMEPIKLFFEMEAGRLMISSVRLTRLFIFFFFFETKLKVKIQKKRGLINCYDDPTSWESFL